MVVKHFSGTECDVGHCMVVAEFRGAVSVHKHSAQKFVVERFSMKRLIEGNGRGDSQLKIAKNSAALENSKDDSRDISRAWKSIRDSKRWKITGRK